MDLRFRLNGSPVHVDVDADVPLVEVVRSQGLLGTKEGCRVGVCGVCTVMVEGMPVSSCIYLAACVEGADVWTVEGLVDRDPSLEDAFVRNEGLQCGICTPGQVVATHAFRDADWQPTRESVTSFMAGNLCRCTGYGSIVEAVTEYASEGVP